MTLLLINLSNTTDFLITIESNMNMSLQKRNTRTNDSHLKHRRKRTASREEYHLTPKDGLLRSSTVLLNGNPLETTKEGDIPNLMPVYRESNSFIRIASWSIAFIVIPDFVAGGCK